MLGLYQRKYTEWVQSNPGKCPSSFDEFAPNTNPTPDHKDPWGNPYIMLCGDTAPEGHHFGVVTYGPDAQDGTADDMRSW